MSDVPVRLRPIEQVDTPAVARFLQENLNRSVSVDAWLGLMNPPWQFESPNRGFLIEADDSVVGAYVAVYAGRSGPSGPLPVCNLAAFCVLEPYRSHAFRLVRTMLSQRGFEFTDLSPSGNVVALNERLGFQRLDTTTSLVINVPWFPPRGVRVIAEPTAIGRALRGSDAQVFNDHKGAAAVRHLVVQAGDQYAYLLFRRDRRKGLPLFATPLYVGGDPVCLQRGWGAVAAHLLLRHRLPFTLAEPRVLGFVPVPGRMLRSPRAKMIRGDGLDPATVDYLYSELTLLEW